MGFDVRKHNINKSKNTGKVTSRVNALKCVKTQELFRPPN